MLAQESFCMGRTPSRVHIAFAFLLATLPAGCGGGGAAFVQPPPPVADFTIQFSQPMVSVSQGASSSAVNIAITPENGFSGSVAVTLSGLPAGVSTNPASPFTITVGVPVTVVFAATISAVGGAAQISAGGTSGSLSHAASCTLTVQAQSLPAVSRSGFARSDSIAAFDNPPGEFHHRHVVYDSAHLQVFVANRAMNRVEVFSSTTQSRTAQVAVPGVSSVDLSPDGATVWAGSLTERVFAIDTSSLQVKASYTVPSLAPIPNTVFDLPEEVLVLSGGKYLLRLRQGASAEALLALWDPSTNAPIDLTLSEPQLFQNGLGAIARSGDGSRVLVGASDSSGELALFDSNGKVVAGPRGVGAGAIPMLAANANGTAFAVSQVSNGSAQLYLLDASLNPVAGPLATTTTSLVFSLDGTMLYVAQPAALSPVINIFDARSLALLGQVPDVALQVVGSQIEDVDSTQLLFALGNRGIAFVDAGNPLSLQGAAPAFAAAPAITPSEGPTGGGTALSLNGANFTGVSQVRIGGQSATSVVLDGASQLKASSPSAVSPGAVNVFAYFSNGWIAAAADAFSYGPQILQILPNAGSSAGGETVRVYGYGFGGDPTKISVKFGAGAAVVQSVQNVTGISAVLALDASYPFSLECVTVRAPAGTAGKADLAIAAPSGAATEAKGYQYLQSEQFFGKPGLYKFIAYDQKRQHIYLSNIDHVDVFDLASQQFIAPLNPPGGPPPNAGLRGLSVAPDGSQLVVADFGAQSVYLLDPDTGSGTTVPVGGVAGFLNSGPARVAATSAQTVFVGLTGEGSQGACSSCLGQLNLAVNPPVLQAATQPEVASITGAPLLQANAAGDHVFVSFGASPGSPLALWEASSPNQFTIAGASSSATDIAASADGTMFATQSGGATQIRAADLSLMSVPVTTELAGSPGRNGVPGVTLHPSGALIYQPFLTAPAGSPGVQGGVDILDAHSGALRMRIFLQQQFMTDIDGLHGGFLTTDENGQRLFAITSSDGSPQNSGITVVQLAKVPLGIGTLTPATGSAAGGASITLRGSGFVSGVTVSIGGKNAVTTFKDANTLTFVVPALRSGSQQIQLKNPDGETVSLDAAFTAN
jgi:WD40 repeat protein